jgi:hypothetical protein
MVTFQCNDCKKPLAPTDNQIVIPQMIFVEGGRRGTLQDGNFCDKGCLNSWLTKNGTIKLVHPHG